MKRVLQVTGGLNTGGLETVAMNIVRNSDKEKIKYDFLVYDNREGDYEKEARLFGCKVFHIKRGRGSLNLYNSIKHIIMNYGPYDVVHSHTYFNSGIVMLAAYKCNVPIRIAHAHSIKRRGDDRFIKKTKYHFLRLMMRRCCTNYVACSLDAGEYVFGKDIFDKCGLIFPNLIDVKKYAYSNENKSIIRKELNISNDSFVIGNVGRLTVEKNQTFLLNVFSRIVANIPNSVLVIVGDGELKNDLKKQAENLRISDKVIFTGTRKDVGCLMSVFDVFVFPSIHEGFGIVAIEAMANGLKCVCEQNSVVAQLKALSNCIAVNGFELDNWCNKVIDQLNKRSGVCPADIYDYDYQNYKSYICKLYQVR